MMYLSCAAGFVLLFLGGEALVRGAVDIARRLGIAPLVIALTVVAFGTSAPELLVSVQAARGGNPDLALGNVVGSCIANVALILGFASLVRPLRAHKDEIRLDLYAMLGAFALLALFSRIGYIGRAAGLLMVGLLGLFIVSSYQRDRRRQARRREASADGGPDDACEVALEVLSGSSGDEELRAAALEVCEDWRVEEVREVPPTPQLPVSIVLVLAGLAGLVFGANLLVSGATRIAETFGVPDAVIGLTVVAIGTSLPELTTSVIATYHHQPDVAVGNVLGSNVFNVLAILGITAIIAPITVAPSIARADIVFMFAAGIIVTVLLLTRERIGRLAGGLLFAAYLAYVVSLFVG